MSAQASIGRDLVVREYVDADEPEVLELLRGSLGGGPAGERTPEYFRWKHLRNPFGRSFMIVAESDQRIIGFRALMRWRFNGTARSIEAVRPVDTVTHPEHRGRGVFSMLTRTALESLKGQVDLVFNTPNANSLPGYLKMGWQLVGEIPVSVRICKPARFVAGKLRRTGASGGPPPTRPTVAAPTAGEMLSGGGAIATLIEGSEVPDRGFWTPKSVEYLRWRYGEAPLLGYHAVHEERAGEVVGLALFRLRPQGSMWGLSVGDVIVRPGDVGTARRLVRAAREAADVAYLAMSFPRGSAGARALRGTALRAPRGMAFVVNPLGRDLEPDPRILSSWALSTGDVEVF